METATLLVIVLVFLMIDAVLGITNRVLGWRLRRVRRRLGWKPVGRLVYLNGQLLNPRVDYEERDGKLCLDFQVMRAGSPDEIQIVEGEERRVFDAGSPEFRALFETPPVPRRPKTQEKVN